jgi:site-specific recombinase XerD
MKSDNKLSSYLRDFLQEYLPLQKGFSRHTVLSYRDTIKLFLTFSADRQKKSVTDLTIADLGAAMVVDFLDHLEKKRENSRQTRNIRLACLHTLFRYLARHDPLIFDHCQRVLAVPFKRTQSSAVEYLEGDEIKAILQAVDRSTSDGCRYYTLFYFMYNTGARVAEVINLPARALQLERPFQVRILGKGAKERLCPLWPDTAKLLRALLKQRGLDTHANDPVFINHRGRPLTRHGIRYLLNKYVLLASKDCPSLMRKHIHPHSIRHTTAMHLLQSGVDINTIRAWLGHTNLETTNRYAEINLEMKRKVLNNYLPIPNPDKHPWKQNSDILQWLESL